MYPYFVLDLPHTATAQQIEARYEELIRRYPPDHCPAQFHAVRSAYEALSSEAGRLRTRLFYVNPSAAIRAEEIPDTTPQKTASVRLTTEDLARLILEGEPAA